LAEDVNDYFEWAAKQRRAQGTLAAKVMESVKDKPDDLAGVYNIARGFEKISGIMPSLSMAKQFAPDFEREIIREQNMRILANTPKLSLWMRNPDFAGLAKDDVENLGNIEGFVRAAMHVGARAGARVGQVYSQHQFESHALADERYRAFAKQFKQNWGWTGLAGDDFDEKGFDEATLARLEEGARYWADKIDYFSSAHERNPKSQAAQSFEDGAHANEEEGFLGTLASWGGAAVNNPLGALAWALETAGESALNIAAAGGATALTRNPYVGAGVMGAGSYITERGVDPASFYQEKGFDLSKADDVRRLLESPEILHEAAKRGQIRGAVIGAMDMLSFAIAGKAIGGEERPLVNMLAQTITQAVMGSSGEYLARKAAGQKIDWNDVMAEGFAEMATAPVDILAAGGKLRRQRAEAVQAQEAQGILKELGRLAKGSKLRERAPDQFREFVKEAIAGDDKASLYVNAGALNEYFQTVGLDGRQVFASLEGVGVEDFTRALESGSDIEIPTASFAAHIAGTDLEGFFIDNARFAPDEMSGQEAKAFNERIDEVMEETWAEIEQMREEEEASRSFEQVIYDEMVSRLRLAGRAQEVATNEAMIYPAFYRTMAERSGRTIEEMMRAYPLPEVRSVVADDGREYGQAGRDSGGRQAEVQINGEAVLKPLMLEGLSAIGNHREARAAVPKGTYANASGDKVLVSNGAVKKWFYGKDNPVKWSLAPRLPEIFEQSVTYHKGGGFQYAAGLINLDGRDIGVRFVIRQEKGNPDRLYQIEGVEIMSADEGGRGEKGLPPIERASPSNEGNFALQRGGDTHGSSVAQIVEAFNRLSPRSSPYFQHRRGSILVGGDGGAVINLFERADLSTLLHESGHHFLNIMQDMAAKGEASSVSEMNVLKSWWRENATAVAADGNQAIKQEGITVETVVSGQDVATYLDEGTTGNADKDKAIDIGLQEQFARGFEAYLMEGKAPSEGLRAAFEKFRAWLIAIYKKLAGLNVKISDDVREVFDRMLATDEEIAAAREAAGEAMDGLVMADAASLGLTQEEYDGLLKKRQEAQDEAKARLLHETMKPLKREREAWYKKERAIVAREAAREVNSWRHYRAFEWLANRRWLGEGKNGEVRQAPDEMGDMRLDKAQLVERYGEGILKTLPRGKLVLYTAQGGADIDIVADLFGFKNADEMIGKFEGMSPRAQAIKQETDRIMNERHGDVLRDGGVEEAALKAVHNDRRGQWLAAELAAITQVAGIKDGAMRADEARQFARKTIAGMKVASAAKPHVFLAAERKAGQEAAKLGALLARQSLWQQQARRLLTKKARIAAKVDEVAGVAAKMASVSTQIEATNLSIERYNETVAKFVSAKRRQLLNHALYSESVRVKGEVEAVRAHALRLGRAIRKIRSGRKNLGETTLAGDYIEPIEAILSSYEFKKVSGKKIDRRAALADFIAKMEAQGRANELAIPEDVLNDGAQVNYMSLSVEHLRGVGDALKNIEHMARLKGKLLMGKRSRDFAAARDGILAAMDKNLSSQDSGWVKKQGWFEDVKRGGRSYIAALESATTILRRIDGRQDLGVAYETIKGDIDKAAYGERRARRQAEEDIQKLYDVYSEQEQRQMGLMKSYEELGGRSFSRWNLIAMALNMGNEGNYQRLTNKHARQNLNDNEARAVKGLLSKKDWDFVQSVWDYLESYKEQIAAREKRLRGVEPKWVEAKPVVTPYGTYRGGYYPIKYDREQGGSRRDIGGDEDIISSMMRGGYAHAATKDGHLKARVDNVRQSLSLDTSVITTHIHEVIHDLHFSQAVVNAWRLLNDAQIEEAFARANMREAGQALKLWVQDVASGQVAADNMMEKMTGRLRTGFTISKLGFNVRTMALQVLGLTQSAVVVGKRNLGAAILQYSKNPQAAVREVLAKSNIMWERRETFNKDLMDIAAKANISAPKGNKIKDFMDHYAVPMSMAGITYAQFYLADVPTWMAAYKKGLRQFGGDDAKAIDYADMTLARTQGSGLWSDRSGIERGTLSAKRQNQFVRLFTTLGSYFFAKMNIFIERTQDFRSQPVTVKRAMDYAFDVFLLFAGEAAMLAAVKLVAQGLTGGDDDDDLMYDIAAEGLETFFAGLPFARDMVGLSKGFQAGTYAAILATVQRPLGQIGQGEMDKALVKSGVDLAGLMFKLPSSQTNRLIDGLWREVEGEDVSMMEYLFGSKKK